MRIASLQPSITLTLSALGRLDMLCAHTRYCVEALPVLADLNLPVLSDSWSASTAEIVATQPDLVIASVPYRMESLAAMLKASLPVLAFAPHTLGDIFRDIHLLGALTDASEQAAALVLAFEAALQEHRTRTISLPRVRVYCEEWGKPLIHSQHWVAELVEAAGGEFVGEPGAHTTSQAVAAADPDFLVFAWCGAGNRVPLQRMIDQRGWHQLRAVQSGRVFCIPDQMLNTPAHTLLDGLACLAGAMHPAKFVRPQHLIQLGPRAPVVSSFQ